ncbi:unnamed protein product [Lota lota]
MSECYIYRMNDCNNQTVPWQYPTSPPSLLDLTHPPTGPLTHPPTHTHPHTGPLWDPWHPSSTFSLLFWCVCVCVCGACSLLPNRIILVLILVIVFRHNLSCLCRLCYIPELPVSVIYDTQHFGVDGWKCIGGLTMLPSSGAIGSFKR